MSENDKDRISSSRETTEQLCVKPEEEGENEDADREETKNWIPMAKSNRFTEDNADAEVAKDLSSADNGALFDEIESDEECIELDAIEPNEQSMELDAIAPIDQTIELDVIEPVERSVEIDALEPLDQSAELEAMEALNETLQVEHFDVDETEEATRKRDVFSERSRAIASSEGEVMEAFASVIIQSTSEDTAHSPPAVRSGTIESPETSSTESFPDVLATPHDRTFYEKEAKVLEERQPERAALMWYETAITAERSGASQEMIVAYLENALQLRPDSLWLLPLARRLYMRLRRYNKALDICLREVELGGDTSSRVSILCEAAAIVRYCDKNPTAALEFIEKALSIQANNTLVLHDAVSLRLELKQYQGAAEALEQLSTALTVPEERALYLYMAGTICETYLNQIDRAEADYRRAMEADRQSFPVVAALSGIYERRGQWAQYCKTLEHLAQLAPNSDVEARLLQEAGSLHIDKTGDIEAAVRDLSSALNNDNINPVTLQRLAFAYEAKGQMREVVEVLVRLVEVTPDKHTRAALWTHIATIKQIRLNDIEGAIHGFRNALKEINSYLPAIQSLGTIYRNQGDYENLLDIYEPEVEGTKPERARAVRCVEMAEILAQKLENADQAIHWYKRALELDPDFYLAFWGLIGLLNKGERFEELAEVFAVQAARTKDEKTRNHLLYQLAQLEAGPLDELDRAIEILEGLQPGDRSRSIALSLLDLYYKGCRTTALVPFLLTLADDTSDPREALGWRLQAAVILEHELEEYNRAIEIYKHILNADPKCVAAARGAGRIYHRLSLWNDLVKLHYNELVTDPERPDAANLLCRIGRILDENLGQKSAAIKAYSKALEKDSSSAPALHALERLVRAEERWSDLVEVLKKYASARVDKKAAADALRRAAEVADFQMENLDLALELYQQVKELDSASSNALYGLLRVTRRKEDWSRAAEILKELIEEHCHFEEERAHLRLELARIKEFRLGQQPDLELYHASAVSSPFGNRLRAEMTRILRVTQSNELVAWLPELGQRTLDPDLSAAHLLECVYLHEFSPSGTTPGSVEAGRQAYQRRPDNLAVIWCLERALYQTEHWVELGTLREKEAQLELEPMVRVIRLSSAAIAFLQAGEDHSARRTARECLNFDAHCLPALKVLMHLAEKQEDWVELSTLCDRLAEACSHPENRLEHCLRAADLWTTQVEDTTRALASLSVALSHNPGQPEAFAQAQSLLRSRGDLAEISRLYRRRIMVAKDSEEKVPLLREHARLLRHDLGDRNRAVREYSEVLSIAPDDVESLLELSQLLIELRHWSDAANKLEVLTERAENPDIQRQAKIQLAELWIRHLHEPKRAREVLIPTIEEEPSNLEAQMLLLELTTAEGNWQEAKAMLEVFAKSDNLQNKLWALGQLSEIARTGLRDAELSRKYENETIRAAIKDPQELDGLIEKYREKRELSQLMEVFEEVLASASPTNSHAKLFMLTARLFLEEMNQPSKALPHLKKILEQEPTNREAKILYSKTLEKQGDMTSAAREYRALIEESYFNIEAIRGLARVMEKKGLNESVGALAGLVELFGEPSAEENALLRAITGNAVPAGKVNLAEFVMANELKPIEEMLHIIAPYLKDIFPMPINRPLEMNHAAAVASKRLAALFDLGELQIGSDEQIVGARAGFGEPLPLIISDELKASPGDAVFRFWISRALFSAKTNGAVIDFLSYQGDSLEDLIDAISNPRPTSNAAVQLRKQLQKVLPRKVRKQIEDFPSPSLANIRAYQDLRRQYADQVGLLVSRNPKSGLSALARLENLERRDYTRSVRLRSLIDHVISDEYARKAQDLWR